MSRSLLVLLMALVFTPAAAWAQGTIQGTVTDETGQPLPGANVIVLGTQLGAATGVNGQYNIPGVPAGTHTVRAQFVGYTPLEQQVTVTTGAAVTVNFQLAIGVELSQVVVEGYRVRTVPVESGAISQVDGEQLRGLTARSPDAALQGRASGVRVTRSSGQPGAGVEIQVRGAGSITAGSRPLFVIDGVQVSNAGILSYASGNPLSSISPSDIESIEVLKDAAAASIYGAQAANGVVIVTTRRGRAGTTELNFETQVGTNSAISDFRVMNAQEYTANRLEALTNVYGETLPANFFSAAFRGRPTAEYAAALYGNPETIGEGTNWQDLVFRSALTQSYNVSARGGTDRTTFFASGRYVNDEGQVIASNFEQFGARLNLDHRISDQVQFESRVNLANSNYRGTFGDGAFINSPYFAAQFIPPTANLYNTPGEPASGYNLQPNNVFSYNPVAQEEFNTLNSNVVSIVGSSAITVELMEGLFSRSYGGIQFNDTSEERYEDPRLPQQAGVGGTGTVQARRFVDFNVSQTLNYSTALGLNNVHRISSLAGAEYKRGTNENILSSGQGFPNELFRTIASAANPFSVSSSFTEFRQISYFGDAEYTYDNAYQLRGVLRYDGSSRFGADTRFGLFGTIAGYVRPFRTGFIPEVGFLSEFKLRASYGVTGNSDIGNFASRRLFGGQGTYINRPGIRPTSLGNDLLTWEAAREINLGLDYGFLNNRVLGAIELYRQNREELLLDRLLPTDSGFSSVTENVGEVKAEGLELSLTTVNVATGGFQWSTNFNITFQRTEVVSLIEDQEEITIGGLVYRVGEPIRQYRYAEYAGVNPANGRAIYYDANRNLTYRPVSADQNLQGNWDPDFFGGFGNTLSYAGVSLDALFQFDYGRKTLNNDAYFSDVSYFDYNKATRVFDRWQQPGDMTSQPKQWWLSSYPDGSSEAVFTTRFMEDASYIRLKQLRLSYALPQTVTGRAGMRNASIFVQGENLVTWTNFSGIDPEVVGTSIGRYPQAKTLTTGFRIGL